MCAEFVASDSCRCVVPCFRVMSVCGYGMGRRKRWRRRQACLGRACERMPLQMTKQRFCYLYTPEGERARAV